MISLDVLSGPDYCEKIVSAVRGTGFFLALVQERRRELRNIFAPQFICLALCKPPYFGIIRQYFGWQGTNGNICGSSDKVKIYKP